MTASIIRGDARHLPLADNSVDLVVTSPPYFGLRSYQDGGEHYAAQIGSEPTPAEFVEALLDVTRECVRVLKPSGSLWVNLGDKYSGAQAQNFGGKSHAGESAKVWAQTNPKNTGIPNKSLMGIPWRYALRCIDDLGLILRAEVIWSKPNGLPESVTDRVRRSHETWFHFTPSRRYYSAVDAIREAHTTGPLYAQKAGGRAVPGLPAQSNLGAGGSHLTEANYNALGKLPGSVWTIPTQPLTVPASLGVDHFAAFPMEWPRRIIQGWSPSGICVDCGEGRRPVTAQEKEQRRPRGAGLAQPMREVMPGNRSDIGDFNTLRTITGEKCACSTPSADTTPATVLDPFGGTGTTALVASALGRRGVSVDYSSDYCRLAAWRTSDPGQRAKAMQVEAPKTELPGQADLFGDVA